MRKWMKRWGQALWKDVWKIIGILAGAVVLGTVLMTLAYCVPLSTEIVEESNDFAYAQGAHPAYPMISRLRASYFHSYLPGVFDGGTMIYEVNQITSDIQKNPLYTSMVPEYARYWHGYVSILRPLMYFINYEQLQILNSYLQLFLIGLVSYLVGTKMGKRYLCLLGTSFALICYPVVAICFQYTWVFWIAFGMVALYLWKKEWFIQKRRLRFLFLAIGILTCYFDLLTYPLYTWGIPMIFVLLSQKEEKWIEYVKETILFGIFWITGYLGMWIGKWAIASLILGENIFSDALEAICFRAGDETGFLYRLIALNRNWQHYAYILFAALLFIWLAYWIIKGFFRGWKYDSRVFALCLTALSSIVWYLILSGHTYIHHHFTYRIFGIALTSFTGIVLVSTQEEKVYFKNFFKKISAKSVLKRILCFSWIVALAFCSTLFSYEETEILNYGTPDCETVEYTEPIEYTFIPYCSHITKYRPVMYFDSYSSGLLAVLVYDGNQLLYEEISELSTLGGGIMEILVNWKLEANHEYRIVLELRDFDGVANYLITPEKVMPIEGAYLLDDNANKLERQPCFGISYFYRPFSIGRKLFYLFTWMGIWNMFVYMLYCMRCMLPKQKENRIFFW